MPKRHLLLCFDAFGTLFNPKRPIPQQYGEIARSLGHRDFSDDDVQTSFKVAFKAAAKQNPNFGKANGMNPTTWWTNIIHNTFRPLVGVDEELHEELAPRLLHRFASAEGYILAPGMLSLLRNLRAQPPANVDKLAIGVTTNSDDRVPGILTSLGLHVSPLVYSNDIPATSASTGPARVVYDVDFTVMSYDVGHEKPDKRIFAAAEELLLSLPVAQGTKVGEWQKVYVGDEYGKDVVGAKGAGWGAVLIDEGDAVNDYDDVVETGEDDDGELLQLLQSGLAVSVKDFGMLGKLLGLASTQNYP